MKRIREARVAMPPPAQVETEWPAQGEWTYEDYARLPDDGWRYEVIKGVLHMTPAPRTKHQKAIGKLYSALTRFVEQHDMGDLYFAPIDVILPHHLATPVQPDLLFISKERLDIVKEQFIEGAPDLIVEVLSPTNWLDDRRIKYEVYAEAGVREYWIVDPDLRTVEVFVLREGEYALVGRFGPGEKAHSEVLEGFEVAVDEVLPE
jgi:Uma2 family endonuclease